MFNQGFINVNPKSRDAVAIGTIQVDTIQP